MMMSNTDSRKSKAAILVARRAVHAAAVLLSFNKPQKLPKDARFLTTVGSRDVYAFEEWFYYVDPNTNEVVEVTLQRHVPFLQKYLKKGFLARLGLAASDVDAEEKPWKKPAPGGKKKTLTDAWKAKAKKRADAAGRKYPNLVDNMWATEQMSKASASVSAATLSTLKDLALHPSHAVIRALSGSDIADLSYLEDETGARRQH